MSPRAGWTAGSSALALSLLWLLVTGSGSVVAAGADDAVAAPDAVDASTFTRRLYVGAGVGGSRIEPESPIADLVVGDEQDTGFQLMLGYDFTRRLSAELYAADLGAARIDRRTPGAEERGFDAIDYRILDLAAVIYLFDFRRGPDRDLRSGGLWRREGPSLYARLGAGVMRNDDERGRVRHARENEAHLTAGLGLEYGFGNGIALRAEYLSFDTDARVASVGVLKRFGRVRERPEPDVPDEPVAPVPDPVPIPDPEPEPMMLSSDSHFGFDSAVPTPEGRAELDRVAALVGDGDDVLHVHGHTDSVGPESYNEGLALRRAEAVGEYLFGRGIARARLRTAGFGERCPIADNATKEGRALNRRVEIRNSEDIEPTRDGCRVSP